MRSHKTWELFRSGIKTRKHSPCLCRYCWKIPCIINVNLLNFSFLSHSLTFHVSFLKPRGTLENIIRHGRESFYTFSPRNNIKFRVLIFLFSTFHISSEGEQLTPEIDGGCVSLCRCCALFCCEKCLGGKISFQVLFFDRLIGFLIKKFAEARWGWQVKELAALKKRQFWHRCKSESSYLYH